MKAREIGELETEIAFILMDYVFEIQGEILSKKKIKKLFLSKYSKRIMKLINKTI